MSCALDSCPMGLRFFLIINNNTLAKTVLLVSDFVSSSQEVMVRNRNTQSGCVDLH
jgi:hypothetical protein